MWLERNILSGSMKLPAKKPAVQKWKVILLTTESILRYLLFIQYFTMSICLIYWNSYFLNLERYIIKIITKITMIWNRTTWTRMLLKNLTLKYCGACSIKHSYKRCLILGTSFSLAGLNFTRSGLLSMMLKIYIWLSLILVRSCKMKQ